VNLSAAIPASPAARLRADNRRLLFIDNLRWTMIVLVLSMHACDTYSPFGNWYYKEHHVVGFGSALFFATYQSFLQAFFMALLFFVAGYFAVPSYDRKGFSRFLRDRILRLGVPTLLYMFVIGPLTQYFLSRTWGSGGFAHQWVTHLRDGEWLSETGPMWFCAALLIFCVVYALLRLIPRALNVSLTLPGNFSVSVVFFLAVMAAATFLVRVWFPEDRAILNMHPGDFPQYALMFAAGISAARGRWLTALDERFCLRCSALTLAAAAPLYVALLILGGAFNDDLSAYSGGLNAVSAGKCLWEALVCVGASFFLLAAYRRHFDRQGRLARSFSDAAFGVYLIHPPILISSAFLLQGLAVPPIAKAALLTATAGVFSYVASALVLRRTPLLRKII
jgi:glucans biosynthesis protein C